MANMYYKQIKYGITNKKTGEPWKLEDVPRLYRAKVKELLDADEEYQEQIKGSN